MHFKIYKQAMEVETFRDTKGEPMVQRYSMALFNTECGHKLKQNFYHEIAFKHFSTKIFFSETISDFLLWYSRDNGRILVVSDYV